MRSAYAKGGLGAFLCFLLASCSGGSVLTVRVATGLVPGPEFSHVETEIIENNVSLDTAHSLQAEETVAAYGQSYARGYTVATFSGMARGLHTIRVTLWRPDGTKLIQKRMRITMDGDFVVTVALTRDCVDVECPAPGGSAAFTECLAGRCVSPDCNPPQESAACGDVTFCNEATECGETSSCAMRNCFLGVCHPEPIAEACEITQWCDPDVGQGCVPFPITDGGVADGGVPDAGADAEVIACGRACTPADDLCSGGYWDCSGSTPVCARLGRRPVGTVCAEDRACDAHGECVMCREGAACRIGCATGTVSCASGTEQCVLPIIPAFAPALTHCAFGTACVGDDACGTGDLCTSAGECVACVDGDICNDGCALGTLDCATGACTLDGTHLPQGAYCAPGSYCDAANACAPCEEHAACVPSLVCWDGEIVGCATHPACTLTSPTSPGRPCDTGACSGSGACVVGLTAVDTAMSSEHNCVLRPDHTLVCFGSNTYGTLATGDTMSVPLTARVPIAVSDIASIASGYNFSCALTTSGELWCWGFAWGGVLPTSDFYTAPFHVALPGPADQVVLGFSDACVRLRSGDVWCAGGIYRGTTGDPSELGFVQMTDVHNAVQLASAFNIVCARLDTGHIKCWGTDDVGQLGDGRSMVADVSNPVDVVGIDDAIDVSVADTHGCAVRADASLWCWGGGGAVIQQEPSPDAGGALPHAMTLPFTGSLSVVTSYGRTCALAADQQLWCWGSNYSGSAGVGSPDDPIAVPTALPGLDHVEHLPALGFGYSACAIQDGFAVCWGPNSSGEVGDNTRSVHLTPVLVQGAS